MGAVPPGISAGGGKLAETHDCRRDIGCAGVHGFEHGRKLGHYGAEVNANDQCGNESDGEI